MRNAGPIHHGFTYDDLGNRLTFDENANQTTGFYNEVNELTKLDATQVYYDAAGNLTKDADGYTYHYDADNKITRIKKTNDTVDVATYEYDALGRRIEFIDSVNTVTKLYYHEGGRDRVIEEYNGAATPARQRYFVWGNYIDELLMYYEDSDTTDYFVTSNHLFSPAALVSNDGTIQETYEYDAYGKPAIYTATSSGGGDNDWWDGDETTATVSAKNLSYLFTGREFDSLDTDGTLPLYYYRARNYTPTLMRFLQRDPLSYVDGMSLYQYVGSRPIIYLDPNGETGVFPGPHPGSPEEGCTDCRIGSRTGWPIPHTTLYVCTGGTCYSIDGQGPWSVGITVVKLGDDEPNVNFADRDPDIWKGKRWSPNLGQPVGLLKVESSVHGYATAGLVAAMSRPL